MTSRKSFDAMVERALASLPSSFRARIENVAVMVEDWPDDEDLDEAGVPEDETLLGLYQGVALTKRDPSSYHGALPDRLLLYRGPILEEADTKADVERVIRETVIHEVGHYFGLSESEIQRAEGARPERGTAEGGPSRRGHRHK